MIPFMGPFLFCFFLVLHSVLGCPDVCDCIWRHGKITAECPNKSLNVIPENIDPQTQVLDISGNRLQSLPAQIFSQTGLLNLQKLYLNNCQLTKIHPGVFQGLTNLVELDLSDNKLSVIPIDTFSDIPSLRILQLNGNPILQIKPFSFQDIPGIVRVELSGCQIEMVDKDAFKGIDNLHALKLDGNKISVIQEDTVLSLQSLHNVQLHDNPWHCDCVLRPLKDWLQQYNIPYPISPVCATPNRVRGKTLDELPVEKLACPPLVKNTGRFVTAYIGENATIDCMSEAVPEAQVTWLYSDKVLYNNTLIPHTSHLVVIHNKGHEDKVSSLTVTSVNDQLLATFRCLAENPAGIAETNFSLITTIRLAEMGSLDETQIIGITLALIILIVIILTVMVLLLMRSKNPSSEKTKVASVIQQEGGKGGMNGTLSISNPIQKPPRTLETPYSTLNYSGDVGIIDGVHYYKSGNNPDIIKEAKNAKDGKGDPGKLRTSSSNDTTVDESEIVSPTGAYNRVQSDSLYPSGMWTGSILNVDQVKGIPSDFNPNLSYDSDIPTHSTPHMWKDSGYVMDPVNMGYPPDFGLPMPSSVGQYHADSSSRLTSSDSAMSSTTQLVNTTSEDLPHQEATSTASSAVSARIFQQGVHVLPPVPRNFRTSRHSSDGRESPGVDGTEV